MLSLRPLSIVVEAVTLAFSMPVENNDEDDEEHQRRDGRRPYRLKLYLHEAAHFLGIERPGAGPVDIADLRHARFGKGGLNRRGGMNFGLVVHGRIDYRLVRCAARGKVQGFEPAALASHIGS